jgi:hypothetical protein
LGPWVNGYATKWWKWENLDFDYGKTELRRIPRSIALSTWLRTSFAAQRIALV